MTPQTTADVIIVGAGLQGCATALYLARAGQRVMVFEKDSAGRHASGVNAGGVRRLFRDSVEIPLSLVASEIWHDMEALVGNDCGFQQTGQVKIAENDADMQMLADRETMVRDLGYTHKELVDARELRWQVETGGHTYAAPVLVNCAGAWGGRIAAMVGDPVPVTPVALTMMITARQPHFLDPVVGLADRPLSFKQMPNGTVVIGGGHRSRLDFATGRTRIDFAAMAVSARTAIDVFPHMESAPVVRCWAGIEGIMPDNIPVIGPSPAKPGAFHAFGFSGHGFQLTPVVGKIMAQLILEGQSDLPIDAFRVDRFKD